MLRVRVLDAVIKRQEDDAESITQRIRATQEGINDAPNPMQSRSDKTRFELGGRLAELKKVAQKLERQIVILQALKGQLGNCSFKEVGLGALVRVRINGKAQNFIVLPEHSMTDITVGGEQFMVVNPSTPVISAIWGKGEGEKVEFSVGSVRKEVEVLNVE